MENKKIVGGTGITAGGDVVFGDISGQVVIGKNITQVQAIDRKREKLEGYLTEHSKNLVEGPIKNWYECNHTRSTTPECVTEGIGLIIAIQRPHTKSEIINREELDSGYGPYTPKHANLVIEHLRSGYTNNVDTWLECRNIIRSYLEKKFNIFEVIEEKLVSKIPESFKEYNDKIGEKGPWYLLPLSVREIYETIQHFITSGELYKLIIHKDSDLFKIRFKYSDKSMGTNIAMTTDENLASQFKEIVDGIITSGDLIGQIKLCMEEDKRRKEKTDQFFQEFGRIIDDFKNGHINLKGFCSRCKPWHDELDDLIK